MADQPTMPPATRKVVVGAAAGAIMTIIAWTSNTFLKVPIPAEIALAGSTVIVFIVQWFVPNSDI